MSTTDKVRFTLCLTWPGEPARTRLHGVFVERDQADKRAAQWRKALDKRGSEVTVTVLPIYPSTVGARDHGMPSPYPSMSEDLAERLPTLPGREWMDGYDWADSLKDGWHAVAMWGCDGWDLGGWPYQIVVLADREDLGVWGVATYTEGDLSPEAFPTREARDARTAELALWYWKHNGNGPHGKDVEKYDTEPINPAWLRPYRS